MCKYQLDHRRVFDTAYHLDGTTALTNGNFVIAFSFDYEGGIVDAGSVKLVNGVTGVQIGTTIPGSIAGDIDDGSVTGSTNGEIYILSLSKADKNTMLDSGLVRLIAQ